MALFGGDAYGQRLANQVADLVRAQINAAASHRFRPGLVDLTINIDQVTWCGNVAVKVRAQWPNAFIDRFTRHVTRHPTGWTGIVDLALQFHLGWDDAVDLVDRVPANALRGIGPMLVNAMFPTNRLGFLSEKLGLERVVDTPEVQRAVATGRHVVLLHPLQLAGTCLVLCLRRLHSRLPLELERHVLSFALVRLRPDEHGGRVRGRVTFQCEGYPEYPEAMWLHDWLQQP